MSNLKIFLDLCDLDDHLRLKITQSCLTLENFLDKKNNWITQYEMHRDQFERCLNMFGYYQHALIECEHFDIVECVDNNGVDSFIAFVEKYSDTFKSSRRKEDFNLSVYKVAFNEYLHTRKTRPEFPKFLSFHNDQVGINDTRNTVLTSTLMGMGGFLVGSFFFPVGSVVGGVSGALIGGLTAVQIINPYLNE